MNNKKTEIFLLKRSLILIIIIITLSLFFFKTKMLFFIGLLIGYLIGTLNLHKNVLFANEITSSGTMKKATALIYLTINIMMLALMFIAARKSTYFLFSLAAGILVIPCTIMFYIITEYFNLTRNKFE